MIIPELKGLHSPDLDDSAQPMDPEDCSIFFEASIGPREDRGEEIFSFTVVTPRAIVREAGDGIWGRGYLILPRFSWEEVERRLQNLLAHCRGPSWNHVANRLNLELKWEFDNYSPYDPPT
jgi:hypothetical protein